MDRRYTVEVLKHLEKQNELLTEVHRSMSQEVHKLQVEEEMLMRKFYELMAAQGLTKKNEDGVNATDDQETGHSTALVCTTDHLGLEEYQAYLKNMYPSENPVGFKIDSTTIIAIIRSSMMEIIMHFLDFFCKFLAVWRASVPI